MFLLLYCYLLISEGYLNGPGSIKGAFRHRASCSRKIGRIFTIFGGIFVNFSTRKLDFVVKLF